MECGEPLATHALRAVLEALDIPHPATVGDGEVHDKILARRTMHAVVFLQNLLGEPAARPEWELEYFRDKLAEHPAAGYRTWDEAVAELRAREQAEAVPDATDGAAPRCGSPASCGELGHEHLHTGGPEPAPVGQPHQSADGCEPDPAGCFAPSQVRAEADMEAGFGCGEPLSRAPYLAFAVP